MAITGIDTIEGKQIIAAGAVSAKSAEMAYNDENGNPITGYQPAGDYLTTADSANFYTTANESGFISEVPAGTMNESEFEYSGGMITAYNGSAFAQGGGGEFPQSATEAVEYVTATSANIDSTIDNVSANSGVWGGSALPISAGPGIKFEIVDGTLVASTNETIIFNGNISGQITNFNTNEQINNFEKLNVYYCCNDEGNSLLGGNITTYDTNVLTAQNQISLGGTYTISNGYTCFYNLYYTITNGSAFSCTQSKRYWVNPPSAVPGVNQVMYNPTVDTEKKKNGYIYKIVGINRIAGGN